MHLPSRRPRAVTVSDKDGRTALYLGSLSSSLVALTLVGSVCNGSSTRAASTALTSGDADWLASSKGCAP